MKNFALGACWLADVRAAHAAALKSPRGMTAARSAVVHPSVTADMSAAPVRPVSAVAGGIEN